MKVKLLVVLSLFFYQFSFSQNQELIQGKVLNQNLPISSVDVINFNTKEQTKTDQFGDFSIAAKVNDLLIFISKNYELKRLVVNPKFYDKNYFSVILNLKPEELKEVVVEKKQNLKLSKDKKYEQSKLDEYATEKYDSREGYQAMRKGTFVNGLNFVTIGKKLLDLVLKEKEPKKESPPEIEFVVLAKNTFDQKFYLDTLKLKPEEIDLFLQFCDTDPKSKTLIKNHNVLSMMDFLTLKNKEFKNLETLK